MGRSPGARLESAPKTTDQTSVVVVMNEMTLARGAPREIAVTTAIMGPSVMGPMMASPVRPHRSQTRTARGGLGGGAPSAGSGFGFGGKRRRTSARMASPR